MPAADLLLAPPASAAETARRPVNPEASPHEVVREHAGGWSLLDELEDKRRGLAVTKVTKSPEHTA